MPDLDTIEEMIAKTKADLAFWEEAKRVLTDPRMRGLESISPPTQMQMPLPARPIKVNGIPQGYGSVHNAVFAVLPRFGSMPMGSADIVRTLLAGGFQFRAKHQVMAVNDALGILETAGKAVVVRREGVAKLWTKKETETQEAPEGAS
jgi:hypothetical protein